MIEKNLEFFLWNSLCSSWTGVWVDNINIIEKQTCKIILNYIEAGFKQVNWQSSNSVENFFLMVLKILKTHNLLEQSDICELIMSKGLSLSKPSIISFIFPSLTEIKNVPDLFL